MVENKEELSKLLTTEMVKSCEMLHYYNFTMYNVHVHFDMILIDKMLSMTKMTKTLCM